MLVLIVYDMHFMEQLFYHQIKFVTYNNVMSLIKFLFTIGAVVSSFTTDSTVLKLAFQHKIYIHEH